MELTGKGCSRINNSVFFHEERAKKNGQARIDRSSNELLQADDGHAKEDVYWLS